MDDKGTEVSNPLNLQKKSNLKVQRSTVKRKITLQIKSLNELIEHNGSKTRIKQIVSCLESCLLEAEKLNVEYIALIPEEEQEAAYEWYDTEFLRVNNIVGEAAAYLDLLKAESRSETSSVCSGASRASSTVNVVNSARARAKAAEVFARKQREIEGEKQKEMENRLRLKKELLRAEQAAENARFELEMRRQMSEEMNKTRELEAETACLKAEADELEKNLDEPEDIETRLQDFDEFQIDEVILPPPEAFSTDNQPLLSDLPETECKHPQPVFDLPSSTPKNPPRYREEIRDMPNPSQTTINYPQKSWISQLGEKHEDDSTRVRESHCPKDKNQNIIYHSSDNLPKLKLDTFDGDPLQWTDWMSMFQSIIHEANISPNAKMQHLQNSVTGRAKEAIEGLGYTGDSYITALEKLESRFGKPDVVVKANLSRLRKWNKLSDDRLQEVRRFSDAVSTAVNTFRRLDYVEDLQAANNLNMIVDKLSPSLVVKWKEYKRDRGLSRASLDDFSKWIESQAEVYDEFTLRASRPHSVQHDVNPRARHSSHVMVCHNTGWRSTNSDSTTRSSVSCAMGDSGPHKLYGCPKFKELSVQDRLKKLRELDLCFRCFGKHWAKDCKSTKTCGIGGCTRLHHELLHKDTATTSESPSETKQRDASKKTESEISSAAIQVDSRPSVLLQIVPVIVFGPSGRRRTYALLDSGSTCSLIVEELVNSLKLDGKVTSLDLNGIQVTSRLHTQNVSFSVGPDDESGSKYSVNNALAVERLNLPPANAKLTEIKEQWRHLSDLELQDLKGVQVQVVLGSDVTEIIIPREVREGPRGSPFGVKTKLGWMVTGSLPGYTRQSESVNFLHVASPEEELNELVKSWWKTESFGCTYDCNERRSREDEKVLRMLEDNTCKVDGRYEVGLIWKDQNTVLPNNRMAAEKRLCSLEKRLSHDPDLNDKYRQTIENDLVKGYIRKVPEEELSKESKREWYLPHHPVLHPNKPGKVRRVCDAAASHQGTSLNNNLLVGPDLLNSLVGMLMRFRQDPIAVSADIEAMFSQVAVPPDDQTALRFLWREKPEDAVEVYKYVRHIFGAKSAPTCANYALRRTAHDNAESFPEEANIVLRNFYMDDLFKSVPTLEKACALQTGLVDLLSLGGFHLTKWISNNKQFLKTVPEEERAQSVRTITDESSLPVERALGVVWNVQEDSFTFKIKSRELANTCRKIVSISAALFDPIGFLAPFVLKAKMFVQKLWQLRQGWDDEIPAEFQEEWSQWQRELEDLEGFSVPRFYRDRDTLPTTVQLHVFGDASLTAFCAVAYFRFEYPDGQRRCLFVAAQTRVAPVKPLSIPKLELQAALLAARLAKAVQREHDYEISSTWYWTDSSAVLGQIRGHSKRHPAFIANRISEILDLSEPRQWRHCPGKLNPADEGSRGLSASEINPSCRWLNGPAFLTLAEEQWPEDLPLNIDEIDSTPTEVCGASSTTSIAAPIFELTKYSSCIKTYRVTAWCMRFVYNCRNKERRKGPLKVREFKEAKLFWIKLAQSESFGEEINSLKSGKPLPLRSSLMTLTPFLDENKVLRVGGRIDQAEVDYDVKHPIIISQKHSLCNLIVMDLHERLHHEGTEHVRNELRQAYWIPQTRSTVRRVLNDCPYCRKRKAKPQVPLMASLPKDRLTVAPPFTKVGVDYFGPLTVKHLRKQEKRYGCLFTCLVTRAVHLEVATSLETDAFINALRRFIARRGPPTDIYSDNGTNFVGADRELKQSLASLNQSEIEDYLSPQEIQWHFNPPVSPHFGGVWERLVQSCKKTLKVVLHGQVVTNNVLQTAMAETEALVNSRPLTEVSSDADDLEAITPNHFLLSRANPVLPIGVFADKEISSSKRWRQVQAILNRVWDRWLKEYLPTLMQRKKWCAPTRNIKVGDLVLLVGKKTSRGDWPLARVTKTFPGKDDTTRVCEVKTKAGVLRRSTAKIALLEECTDR